MSASDVFLLVVRWLHLVSAAAWIGGSLFYLLVLRPALRRAPDSAGWVNAAAVGEFRVLVDTCIFVLLVTGTILSFDRITAGTAGVPYVVTLSVKIALALVMFLLARGRRRRGVFLSSVVKPDQSPTGFQQAVRAVSGYNAIVILGIVVFLLADLLKVLFEIDLS